MMPRRPTCALRSASEGGDIRTPTPLLDDLTDLAIPMPEPPVAPPLPLMELNAVASLDLADVTGVTPLPMVTESKQGRVSLSRPWFASLGVLAFSARLLTAGAAGVIARPVRSAAASPGATSIFVVPAPAATTVVAPPVVAPTVAPTAAASAPVVAAAAAHRRGR